MPYIGQRPATGEANSFKILDEISSFTMNFDGSSASVVSVANDTITAREHRFITGQRVTYNAGGGTAITGLSEGVYYIIVEDRHTFKLATSANNAASGTAVNITGTGAGASHTINVAFDGVNTKFKATVDNGTRADITRSAQLMLSVNGVVQEPHDNTDSPATGYSTDHASTIIFSVAPAATDNFFGRLIASNVTNFDISDNAIDNLTGDGSTTSFNLSKSPASNQNVLVTIDGVVQYPDDTSAERAYDVAENVLTFASAPGNGVEIQVRHIGFAGATSSSVTGFYGRTGNTALRSTDNIVFNDATVSGDITASGDIQAANVTVTGDLTVQGTTTTLDTELTSVDKLEVAANNTTVGAAITQTGTGDILNLYDGSTEVFTVKDGGNVGIGSDNPTKLLDLAASTSSDGIRIKSTGNTYNQLSFDANRTSVNNHLGRIISYWNGTAVSYISMDAGSDTTNKDDGIIRFWTSAGSGNFERLRITSAGNVGIGLTNPSAKLSVSGNLYVSSDSFTGVNAGVFFSGFNDYSAGVYARNSGDDLVMNAGGAEKFRIISSGNVGIGTAAPDQSLEVFKSSGTNLIKVSSQANSVNGIEFEKTGSTTQSWRIVDGQSINGALEFYDVTNSATSMIIRGGKIGIGTIIPAEELHIHASGTSYIKFTDESSGVGGSDGVVFGLDNPHLYAWNYEAGDFVVATNATEKLRVTSAGNVSIGNGSSFTATSSGRTILEINGSASSLINLDVGGTRKAYHFTDGTDVYSYNTAAGDYIIGSNDTERLRIQSDGDLEYKYDDADTNCDTQVPHGLRIHNTNNTLGRLAGISFSHGSGGTANAGIFHVTTNTTTTSTAGLGDLTFWTKPNGASYMEERLRIDSEGNITGTGTELPYFKSTSTNKKLILEEYTTYNSNSGLEIRKKLPNGNVHPANHWYGDIHFKGWDGDQYLRGGLIECVAEGTPSNDSMPGNLRFSTNSGTTGTTERIRITSVGQIEYSAASGDNQFISSRTNTTSSAGDYFLHVRARNNSPVDVGYLGFYRDTANDAALFGVGTRNTGGSVTERLRVNSTGKMQLGNPNLRTNITVPFSSQPTTTTPKFQVESVVQSYSNAGISAINNSADGYSPSITVGMSWTNSLNSNSRGGAGLNWQLGSFNFVGNDGTNFITGAAVRGYLDGSIGANDMPARLEFLTTPDGSNTPVERMRIDSKGHICFGSTGLTSDSAWAHSTYGNVEVAIDGSGGYGVLHLRGDGAGTSNTRYSMGVGDDKFYMAYDDVNGIHRLEAHNSGKLVTGLNITMREGNSSEAFKLESNGANGYFRIVDVHDTFERLRIHGDGIFTLNTTGASNYAQTDKTPNIDTTSSQDGGNFCFRRDKGTMIIANDADPGWALMYINKFGWSSGKDTRWISFYLNGSPKDNVEWNGTNIVYGTASDYRIKKNVRDFTSGIDQVKQLKVRLYDYIDTERGTDHVGFIAHELQEVIPEAVCGAKDGMRKEEETDELIPALQSVEYGKVTPVLTAALQEALAKIEALEARIAALES